MGEWIVNLLLTGVIYVCSLILGLVKSILLLIFDISNITFFSDDIIGELATRVYIIVGVLMLFKITISCIQYLVNPDKADDKENGFGGIIKRALLAVVMLAFVPAVFNLAKEAQNAIVVALPKIILGQENVTEIDDMGEKIAYTTALGFFGYSSESCNDGSIGGLSNSGSNPAFSSIDDIKDNANAIATASCNGGRRYSFNWLLCLAASGFLVLILVSMVVDVGIRVIKFGFLELIAPIPIASYIDPKTSKKSFDSWVHNSLSVYADLFIRLGVIYLVLYLFMILLPSFSTSFELNDGTTLSTGRSMLVNVAIIIALFMFAKNAPKFICDVLGIKGDGDGSIANMFKRAGGLAGAGVAGLRAARSNYSAQKDRLKGKEKGWFSSRAGAALSAAVGAGSATGRGLKMATWDKKGFNEIRKGASKAAVSARDARNDRIDNLYNEEYNWMDYRRDRRRANLGIPSTPGYNKAVYDVMDSLAQSAAAEKSFGATKMNERPNEFKVVRNGVTYTIATARSYASIQVGTQNVTKPDGTVGTWTVEDQARAQAIQQEVEKRTSYMVTADLIQHDDPTAVMNHQKTILSIKNNEPMFGTEGVMERLTEVFRKRNLIGNDEKMTYDKLMAMTDLEYIKKLSVDQGADLIDAVKSSFEAIRTDQYEKAQVADARAKKTQEAIQNDKKSGS